MKMFNNLGPGCTGFMMADCHTKNVLWQIDIENSLSYKML